MSTTTKPQPITNPRRLLPLQRMNWSRDAYGALLAFQWRSPEEDDGLDNYEFTEPSFDIPF